VWASSFNVFWPKTGGRTITFRVRKDNADDTSAEGAAVLACLNGKASGWQLPPPHHDPEVGNVDSYVQGFAGYSWRTVL
jgi:hypothetical protein